MSAPPPKPEPVAPPLPPPRAPVPSALEPIARSKPGAQVRTLKNGLRVVVVEDHRARLVSLRLFFASGTAADSARTAGSTRFALALLTDRTDRFDANEQFIPNSGISARYRAQARGAQLHFDASPDASWLGLDGYSRDASGLLRMLDEVVSARRRGREAFGLHLQGAIDAVNELEFSEGDQLERSLTQIAFGADHVYARSERGTATSLAQLGIEDAIARQDALLTPVGTTLLIAGDVDGATILRDAERVFGNWRGPAPAIARVPPTRLVKKKSVVFLSRQPSRNTLLCVARPLPDMKDLRAAVATAAVVGELRISETLRERLGATYGVMTMLTELRGASAVAVCTRVKSGEATPAMRVMMAAFAALEATPPSADEWDRVKAGLVSAADSEQDSLSGIVASWRKAAELGLSEPRALREVYRQLPLEAGVATAKALSDTDKLQVVISGERPVAESVVRENGLGKLVTPRLERVADD